jgi:hypothetical protein
MSLRYVTREARIDRHEHEQSLCVVEQVTRCTEKKKEKKEKGRCGTSKKLFLPGKETQNASLALYAGFELEHVA